MEREANYRSENRQNTINFFPANPPAVNMAEMMRQTHFGYYPANWEVYRDTVGHDGVRRLERYTPDRKIGAVEQVNGWSRFVERDYRGEDPSSGEGYLETDRRKNYYTKVDDLLVVWRDPYGNPTHMLGNRALMGEYSARSDDLLKRHEAYLRNQEIIRQREARRQEFLRQQAIRAHQEAVRRNQEAIRLYQARLAYHEQWLRGQRIYPGPMPYENPYVQPARPIPPYAPAPRPNMVQAEQYRFPQPPVAQAAFYENQRRQEPVGQRPPYAPAPRSAVAAQTELHRSPQPQSAQMDMETPQQPEENKGFKNWLSEKRDALSKRAHGIFENKNKVNLKPETEGKEIEPEQKEEISVAAIIAATSKVLERQFAAERAEDRQEYELKLAQQQKKHEEDMEELRNSLDAKKGTETKEKEGKIKRGAKAVAVGIFATGALTIEGAKRLTASNEEAAKRMSVPVIDYLHKRDEIKAVEGIEASEAKQAKKEQNISKDNNEYRVDRTGEARIISGTVGERMKNELDSNWTEFGNIAEGVNTENTSFENNFIRRIVMRNRKGQYVSHEDGLTRKEREEIYKLFPQEHS